jgi:hypothetical protein
VVSEVKDAIYQGMWSGCPRIFASVCQCRSYARQAYRLPISPVSTRRRTSAHWSIAVYTPASCHPAWKHGLDSTVGRRSRRSATLLDRRPGPRQALHFWIGVHTVVTQSLDEALAVPSKRRQRHAEQETWHVMHRE